VCRRSWCTIQLIARTVKVCLTSRSIKCIFVSIFTLLCAVCIFSVRELSREFVTRVVPYSAAKWVLPPFMQHATFVTCDTVFQGEVASVVKSINKNKLKSLNREWAAATPAWLGRYAAEVVRTVAEQEGFVSSGSVQRAVELAVRCKTA
jgi:hypothetical protein